MLKRRRCGEIDKLIIGPLAPLLFVFTGIVAYLVALSAIAFSIR
jgi:hypothetical protein